MTAFTSRPFAVPEHLLVQTVIHRLYEFDSLFDTSFFSTVRSCCDYLTYRPTRLAGSYWAYSAIILLRSSGWA
jgi:hypothetical protein